MSRRGFGRLGMAYLLLGVVGGVLLGWGWQLRVRGCRIEDLAPQYRVDYALSMALAGEPPDQLRRAFPDTDDAGIGAILEEAAVALASAEPPRPEGVETLVALASFFGRQRPDLLVPIATSRVVRTGSETAPAATEESPVTAPDPAMGDYVVTRLQALCLPRGEAARARVWVADGAGTPLAGIHLRMESALGVEEAHTGLQRPEDAGYADFALVSGNEYRLHLLDAMGQPASREVRLSTAADQCGTQENVSWIVRLTLSPGR